LTSLPKVWLGWVADLTGWLAYLGDAYRWNRYRNYANMMSVGNLIKPSYIPA